MKTISFKVPEGLDRRIRATARARGASASEVIREVLDAGLPENDSNPESAYEQMKHGFGVFDSGVSDLATNPRYLDGFGE